MDRPTTATPDTGRLMWRHPLPQVIAGLDDSSLAAVPRYAYTEATPGSWTDPVVAVYAFTPTGKLAWTRTFAPARPPGHLPLNIEVGAPVYHDGIVYVGSPIADSEMALKAAAGQVVWRRRLSGPVSSSALVPHGVTLVPMGNGRVAALNARTGHSLRITNLGGQFSTTYPLLLDRTVFLTNLDGQVRAIPWNLLT